MRLNTQCITVLILLSFALKAAPVLTITSPINNVNYKAGDYITCTGIATDFTDGTLTGNSLTWIVDFYHDTHIHDAVKLGTGNKFIFDIPLAGELSADVHYKIKFKAINSLDEETITSIDVWPYLQNFTVTSNPIGARVGVGLLANTLSNTPIHYPSTQNLNWNIKTDIYQTISGIPYVFSHFNDTSYASNNLGFEVPQTDTVFKAFFVPQADFDKFSKTDSLYAILGQDSLIILLSEAIKWGIESPDFWAQPSQKTGYGTNQIIIKLISDGFTENRLTQLSITGGGFIKTTKVLKIFQQYESLELSNSDINFIAKENSDTINIFSNTSWKAQTDAYWIKLSTNTGVGNAKITIITDSNTTNQERVDLVEIKGLSISKYLIVKQAAGSEMSTDISELTLDKVSIYPNPAKDCLTIKNIDMNYNIQIINVLGERVNYKIENFDSEFIKLDISKIPIGIYSVLISNKNSQTSHLLIKN
jgi:hypothetical protein